MRGCAEWPRGCSVGPLSFADEEKAPVHNGSRAKQASFRRSGPSTVGWGPLENGSQALGFSGGSCHTWGTVLHVFLQYHLLPQLILALLGSGRQAGGGGLAQMGPGGGSSPSCTSWDHGAGPRWALGKRRLPAGQSNAKALGMAQRSLFVHGSLKVGLYDGAWEAVSTASALQTGLGGVGKGRAPGKGKANASRPLLPASLLALPLPAMGTRTE